MMYCFKMKNFFSEPLSEHLQYSIVCSRNVYFLKEGFCMGQRWGEDGWELCMMLG